MISRSYAFRVLICGIGCAALSCDATVTARLLPEGMPDDAGQVEVGQIEAGQIDANAEQTSALYFKGPYDRVEIPANPLFSVPQEFALEAWVYVNSYGGGHSVFNRWLSGETDIQLTFGSPEQLPPEEFITNEPFPSRTLAAWVFNREQRWASVTASSQPSAQAWHHIAMSHGGNKLKLYVDGVSVGSADSTAPIGEANTNVYIGATARSERVFDAAAGSYWWPPIDGYIAEVRFSTRDRYTADFKPERRLTSDEATLALWHLDEAGGSIARDSGPHHLDGNIVGSIWRTPPK